MGAQPVELVLESPMGRRLSALEQARRREDHCCSADRRDELRGLGGRLGTYASSGWWAMARIVGAVPPATNTPKAVGTSSRSCREGV